MAAAWRRCPDCEVAWNSDEDECWSCGRVVSPDRSAAPRVTSLTSPVRAFTDQQWADVRREVWGP